MQVSMGRKIQDVLLVLVHRLKFKLVLQICVLFLVLNIQSSAVSTLTVPFPCIDASELDVATPSTACNQALGLAQLVQ